MIRKYSCIALLLIQLPGAACGQEMLSEAQLPSLFAAARCSWVGQLEMMVEGNQFWLSDEFVFRGVDDNKVRFTKGNISDREEYAQVYIWRSNDFRFDARPVYEVGEGFFVQFSENFFADEAGRHSFSARLKGRGYQIVLLARNKADVLQFIECMRI